MHPFFMQQTPLIETHRLLFIQSLTQSKIHLTHFNARYFYFWL